MTLNEKVDYKTVIECGKSDKKIIGLKKDLFGCFRESVLERGDRDKNNDTGLKEGGGIEKSTTVLHSRAAPSLKYLPQYYT